MTTRDSASSRVRVLVVDDSPFMRKAITRILTSVEDIEVVGTAGTGNEALALLEDLDPDVMTLDVIMPGEDGIQVLARVMKQHPLPILMLSSITVENADVTLQALENGAVDFVAKPTGYTHMDMPLITDELLSKIRTAAKVDTSTLRTRGSLHAAPAGSGQQTAVSAALEAVVIGASTGGPNAIRTLLLSMPADYPVPILVVQHMPKGFTTALSDRLDRQCALKVVEARDGDLFAPGKVFIAPSGQHAHLVDRRGLVSLRLDLRPPGMQHVPSIDVAMNSVATCFGAAAMGVLLTGMGEDGAKGLLEMRRAGAFTVAEAETSAVIWGMPRVAAEIGAAQVVACLDEIPSLLLQRAGMEA